MVSSWWENWRNLWSYVDMQDTSWVSYDNRVCMLKETWRVLVKRSYFQFPLEAQLLISSLPPVRPPLTFPLHHPALPPACLPSLLAPWHGSCGVARAPSLQKKDCGPYSYCKSFLTSRKIKKKLNVYVWMCELNLRFF